MKIRICHFLMLLACSAILAVPSSPAQTFTTLHGFSGNDAGNPTGGLVYSSNTLYGTASQGNFDHGSIFAVNVDGTGFTNLHQFNGSDGATPNGALLLSGNTLYGATFAGGSSGSGTVFAIQTNGAGFTVLQNFNNNSSTAGTGPNGGLVASGLILYGTSGAGGYYGGGAVFSLRANGAGGAQALYYFSPTSYPVFTNSDGEGPSAGLTLSGATVFGTANGGGSLGYGTIFAVNTTSGAFTNLHNFSGSDGASPGGLILTANTLYGMTAGGGLTSGTIFRINTNGGGFSTLHTFAPLSGFPPTNSDGANPYGGLVLGGDTLFGATSLGGAAGNGIIFGLKVDGSGFTNLYTFTAYPGNGPQTNSDGAAPFASLLLVGDSLYGTATAGGMGGHGTVFSLRLPPSSNYLAPVILGQSTNVATARGATETLTVSASGTDLQYQWRFGGTNLAGATNASLILANITDSMAGVYSVVLGNLLGTVVSQPVTLAVYVAARQFPRGTWPGIGYWPNVPMTYTVKAGPPVGTVVYAVQDQPAVSLSVGQTNESGTFTISAISDDGTFDARDSTIKWGPFFDDLPRALTYVMTPPPGATNPVVFNGIISLGGTNDSVFGDATINLLPLHPADNSPPIANTININDLTAYEAAWRAGDFAPVGPNPIPISYVTRAGLIWAEGEYYVYNPGLGPPPYCWVNAPRPQGAVRPVAVFPPTNSAAVCAMPATCTPGVPFTVTLTVIAPKNALAYAVEDQFPAGWTVTNPSADGTVDRYNNKVKWGPFSDVGQTFTYQITPPATAAGGAAFTGVASFDGSGIAITGVRQVFSGSAAPVFQRVTQSNGVITLNWSAVPGMRYNLQSTTNPSPPNWLGIGGLITATNSSITVSDPITGARKYYRVVRAP